MGGKRERIQLNKYLLMVGDAAGKRIAFHASVKLVGLVRGKNKPGWDGAGPEGVLRGVSQPILSSGGVWGGGRERES